MKKIFFLSLWLITIDSFEAKAQSRDTNLKYTFPQFWRETGWFYTSPLRWGGMDFLILGGLTTATAAFAVFEDPQRDVQFIAKPLYQGAMAQFGDFYGNLVTPFIFFGAYGGYSLITGNMKARKIAYEIGQSCLYAGSLVTALKIIVGRGRPYANIGKSSFFNFSLTDDKYHSFPSGHVTEAFCLSTVLMMNTDDVLWKIIAYLPVPFTVFSRYYQGYHWLSDCVFGAGIGFFTAKWCVDTHGGIDDPSQPKTGSLEVKSLWPLAVCYNF